MWCSQLFIRTYLIQIYVFHKAEIPDDEDEKEEFSEKLASFGVSLAQYRNAFEMDNFTGPGTRYQQYKTILNNVTIIYNIESQLIQAKQVLQSEMMSLNHLGSRGLSCNILICTSMNS